MWIFNATRHLRHIEAAVIVMHLHFVQPLLSWITHAHLVPLSVTKRRPVHFILNPGNQVWARPSNGLKIVLTQALLEPTIMTRPPSPLIRDFHTDNSEKNKQACTCVQLSQELPILPSCKNIKIYYFSMNKIIINIYAFKQNLYLTENCYLASSSMIWVPHSSR